MAIIIDHIPSFTYKKDYKKQQIKQRILNLHEIKYNLTEEQKAILAEEYEKNGS